MNKEYWIGLVDKYFEGETTGLEEQRLKSFLASEAASDPYFDEARAVMGLFVAARRNGAKARGRNAVMRWASVAAAAVVVTSSGMMDSICYMWENGVRITDTEAIVASAEGSLADIFSGGSNAEMGLEAILFGGDSESSSE